MKITHLDVQNFCGVHSLSLDVHEPLVVIGGENGAGKSSLAEAMRLALTSEGARLSKKSDWPLLVAEGSKGSLMFVQVEHDEGRTRRRVTLPDGIVIQDGPKLPTPEYLPFVTDPPRFARITADERRMLLFELLNVSTTPEVVEGILVERGANREHAAEAASMMRGGFEGTFGYAIEQAKAARAAWKAVTGEVYGTRKGESWRAPEVHFDAAHLDSVVARLQAIAPALDEAQREIGRIEVHQRMAERTLRQVAELRAKIEREPEIREKLQADTEKLAQVEAAFAAGHAVPCPHCGGLVTIHADALAIYAGPAPSAEHEHTLAHYTRQAREALASHVIMAQHELGEINQARTTLANTEAYELISDAEEARARDCADTLRHEADTLLAERRALEHAQGQSLEAEKRTEAAAAYHADVIDWTRISELVSPDGIPSELLQSVLGAFNAQLREYAHMSGFMQATLTPALEITANGRPYALLSESERWRTDAMIAVAIAHYSGLRFVLLDRFDVLDAGWRDATLRWFEHLFQHLMLDAAFIFATLRKRPADEPGFMQCHWIRRGQVESLEREAV